MPSRIRIGPDGGPYVIVEENNGDLDITTPDNTIDLQNSGLINAALSGVLDAQNNDISNVGALTADSVNTETKLNGVYWAGSSSDIQDKINQARNDASFQDGAVVALYPGQVYKIDTEIQLKDGVTLALNNSQIQPTSDVNCIYMEGNTTLRGPGEIKTKYVSGYSSSAILWDTGRYGDRITQVVGTESMIEGPILLNGDITTNGNGFELRTGNNEPISLGCKVSDLSITGFENGILGNCQDGYVHAVDMIGVSITNANTAINHIGTDSFTSPIRGAIQVDGDYGIRSQVSGLDAPIFTGQFWDPHDAGISAFEGDGIRIYSHNDVFFSHGTPADGTILNGIGKESANADTPQGNQWYVGDIVDFTDTGDGSGTGLYLKDPAQIWRRIT